MLDLLQCVAAGVDTTEIKKVFSEKQIDLSNKGCFSFYSGCILHS